MFDINNIINAAIAAAVQQAIAPLVERINALEATQDLPKTTEVSVGVDPKLLAEASLNYLNDQEWFWEKMQRFAVGAAEAAMDEHTQTYDHEDYDNHVCDDDKHFDGDIEDAVREAIGNLTFEVSVS